MTRLNTRVRYKWIVLAGIVIAAVLAITTRGGWWSPTQTWVRAMISGTRDRAAQEDPGQARRRKKDPHSHEGHGHGHDDAASLSLSKQAQGNIGLTSEYLRPLKLETFKRTLTVPGMIVDRPGRTRVEISTSMAGVITHVHAVQGEAVLPGTLLFALRITAEELVATQTGLLRTIGELDVENREIARLSRASESGAVSQKTLLERQYAKERLEVLLSSQREALRLHGLSERQIDDIAVNRRLLRDLQIVAPSPDEHGPEELKLSQQEAQPVSLVRAEGAEQELDTTGGTSQTSDVGPLAVLKPLPAMEANRHQQSEPFSPDSSPLILQEVRIHKGETVMAGTTLAVLVDYSELYIEGRVFEQDLELLSESAKRGWKISASFDMPGHQSLNVENLDLIYLASEIDPESRSLSFFVRLPNEIARETPSPNGQRFLEWKYRPGRRLQLLVPVEEWTEQFVLPVEAIAREGAESFVFQKHGDHFDRVPVRVAYRDATHVVVANDGSVSPGDVIALRGAHQMLMALKNKSGGGADPHAGHSH